MLFIGGISECSDAMPPNAMYKIVPWIFR